jgi:hypothetical protein
MPKSGDDADDARSSDKGAGSATSAGQKDTQKDSRGTGHVKFDDRGNAIWEWSISTGAFATDATTDKLKKLENPSLSIADDALAPFEAVRANPLGTKKGYDPYDSGRLGKRPERPKKKDLRKLSEWLKLKKQADGNNPDEEEPT